jgi:class 3 adenylate cyclase
MGPGDLNNSSLESRVELVTTRDAVQRASILSFGMAVIFSLYGFTSIDFIRKFVASTTLASNVWPRVFATSLPLAVLGYYLRNSQASDKKKLFVWITSYSLVLHAAGWIHIWPIALSVSSEILTYVHGANIFLMMAIFVGVAPPKRFFLSYILFPFVIFGIPLFTVAALSKDPVILALIVNDTGLATAGAILLSYRLDSLRRQLAIVELDRESQASRFLGPVLSKAIFDDERQRLESVRCKGFIISIDIRDSTDHQQALGIQWLEFRRSYFALVSQLVSKHGGYIQKTVGDCHVINFGVMNYGVDLSDIPGVENEVGRAEERRLQRASDSAFRFLDELLSGFDSFAKSRLPDRSVRLGAGIDKGWVERGIQGDASHNLELDVNGDPVNCASRLQEYSKIVKQKMGWDSSILVASPFACDYLPDVSVFSRVQTLENSVRNYTGIKWVLARQYALSRSDSAKNSGNVTPINKAA